MILLIFFSSQIMIKILPYTYYLNNQLLISAPHDNTTIIKIQKLKKLLLIQIITKCFKVLGLPNKKHQ